ncbi:MAG: DUF58 domain-containing protein [Bacteroidota bacterium]
MAVQQIKYLDPVVVSKLKNIEIKARLIVEGFITGFHKSPYHGFSVEFAEHRPYNVGESLRNVDWKVFAKTDKLYTKRFEEETNLRCQVVLDISDSMRYPKTGISKLEYGAYLSAALQYLMMAQRDATGLTLFDEDLHFYAPPKSKKSWLVPMFKKLEEVVENKDQIRHKTAHASVIHQLALKFSRRSFVVIITDLFNQLEEQDRLFRALQHLRHAKHEVILFHLLDRKTEEEFDFPNRPLVLEDLESGEKIQVQPSQIRDGYLKLMTERKALFRRKCHELNIDFVDVDIASTYDKVLTDYLIKRRVISK